MDASFLPQGGKLASYIFGGGFIVLAVAETFLPFRELKVSLPRRWLNHGALFAINMAALKLVFRATGVAVAAMVAASPYGVLNRDAVPYAVRLVLGVALVDLTHYTQHFLYHRIPWLWRVHRVHHTDPDFDVTTGFRFHPIEAVITQGLTLVVIAVFAPPALSVAIAEGASGVQDLLEHTNVAIPAWLDRTVRRAFVTSNMHRIHHSVEVDEQGRNLGTIFSWWDRMFGTYAENPSVPQDQMKTGLAGYPDARSANIVSTLTHPFEGPDA